MNSKAPNHHSKLGVAATTSDKSIVFIKKWSGRWPRVLVDLLSDNPRLECSVGADFQVLLSSSLLGVLSSHPYRGSFRNPLWQSSLDFLLRSAKRNHQTVLYPFSAPYAPTVAYACAQYGVRAIGIRGVGKRSSGKVNQELLSANLVEVNLNESCSDSDSLSEDLAVCVLSDQVVGLDVSPNGKVASVLQRRLECKGLDPTTVWIRAHYEPTDKQMAVQKLFAERGAVLWFPQGSAGSGCVLGGCKGRAFPATQQIYALATAHVLDSDRYLIHATRSRQVAWPDQSDRDLLDEAFRLAWNPNATPLSTLLRILQDQRLIATSVRKRGGVESISFTENPLRDLLKMRTFQSHLARWDWEPYGIALDRKAMESLGCRPVRYITDDEINQLSAIEKAYCQPLAKVGCSRDWRSEREWRLASDLRLAFISSENAFVFVAHEWEARFLVHYSRFPVYYLSCSSDFYLKA